MSLIPVILSGGTGTRLWPLSLPHEPKQFLDLGLASGEGEGHSLIQETVLRLQHLNDSIGGFKTGVQCLEPLIVCNQDHRFLVSENMRKINCKPLSIILEPVGRNTAPALAISAWRALQEKQDAVLLVMPSDHLIQDNVAFYEAIEKAWPQAVAGKLMTFGIVPDSPKTGYGYIQKGDSLGEEGVYRLFQFVEKPELKKAEEYLASGDYFWNSGIFLFRADAFLEALENHAPALFSACQKAFEKGHEGDDYYVLDEASFSESPSDSIDYAVMEKTDKAGVVSVDMGWNDVGSWQSIWEVGAKDEYHNVAQGNVRLESTQNCLIYANGSASKTVALIGVSNLILVDTEEALLVCHRDSEQKVKQMANDLNQNQNKKRKQHVES